MIILWDEKNSNSWVYNYFTDINIQKLVTLLELSGLALEFSQGLTGRKLKYLKSNTTNIDTEEDQLFGRHTTHYLAYKRNKT